MYFIEIVHVEMVALDNMLCGLILIWQIMIMCREILFRYHLSISEDADSNT